jgi:hypothetical protein
VRIKRWLTEMPTLATLGLVLFFVLAVSSGLLMWGANFGKAMVHDQLAEQRITFPAAGSPGLDPALYPGLQQYAGQAVDSGPKAKAYADEFIAVHLDRIAGGKTYSEVSAASQAAPTDAALAAQVQTLFRGETLRGLLLYAWGWSVVASIAGWVAIGAALAALVVAGGLVAGLVAHEREAGAIAKLGVPVTV